MPLTVPTNNIDPVGDGRGNSVMPTETDYFLALAVMKRLGRFDPPATGQSPNPDLAGGRGSAMESPRTPVPPRALPFGETKI
jgi:hypothetical protein